MARSHNTIIIRGAGGQFDERPATAALSPGHLIFVASTGKFTKNATANRLQIIVAREDTLQGHTIDDAYATDDRVFAYYPQKGDIINCRVAAAASAITVGTLLSPAADGTVVSGGSSNQLVAEEDLDNSLGATEAFIKARVV